jgi:hypothetical protein
VLAAPPRRVQRIVARMGNAGAAALGGG